MTTVDSAGHGASETLPMRLTIGVMGSSGGDLTPETRALVYDLGVAIAERNAILITGGCPGLSIDEHRRKYHSPVDGFDMLIYTGSGLMGREIINIRSSDIVVIVGGRTGTLGELVIAYDEGRLIGALTGTGGITTLIPKIIEVTRRATGAHVIYGSDPVKLVTQLVEFYLIPAVLRTTRKLCLATSLSGSTATATRRKTSTTSMNE